jgi:flagellar hook-basal body complex protein FliE
MIGPLGNIPGIGIGSTGFATMPGSLPIRPSATEDVQASFASALGNVVGNASGALQKAEQLSLGALQGTETDTRAVVDAVMSAEQSLQSAIAIRDKIVTAYLEISRMAI